MYAALLAGTSLIGGCAQMHGGGSLAIDQDDACSNERQQFGASKSYFTDEILASTATGAAAGGTIGGLTAAVRHTSIGRGVLGGAAGGGAAGFATGYYLTLSQQYHDRQELAQKVNSDLRTEGTQIDHSLASFGRLRQCRFSQAQLIRSRLRRGQIDHAAAAAALAYQRDRFDEEVRLARSYGAAMSSRDDEFQSATTQLSQGQPKRRASDPVNQATVAATETIPEKRSNYDHAVDQAATASTVAFNIDPDNKSSRRDSQGNRYA